MRKFISFLCRWFFLDYFFFRKKGNITVFMFHKLNYDKTRFYQGVPPDTFEQLCRYIKSHYKVVSLETLKEKKLNSKTRYAVITFDDGHKEIRDVAFPILKKLNLPFNINIKW